MEVKKSFIGYYEEKYLEWESEVTRKKALLQGQITGHILAKKGAREFGEQLENQQFKGDTSLHLICELNKSKERFTPRTLGDYLDVMSYDLIHKDIGYNEKNALKLCVSRIIPTYGPMTTIFDKFFEDQGDEIKKEYKESKAIEIMLPVGMSEEMVLMFDDIISKYSLNKNKTRAAVSEIKANLLKQEIYDEELLQMLDILDIVILDMTRASDHKSELAAYRKAASILDIIFNDTKLVMKDGENASKVTKDTRLFNMNLYEDKDDKKNITGRKIDLIMCSTGLELGSSEWKKQDASTKLIEEQRAKNARVNTAILDNIMNMFIGQNSKDVYVIGMDWLGLVGNMFTVSKSKDVTFVHHRGDLIVPTSIHSITWFKETLNNLFIFKHHLQNLEKTIEPERARLEYHSQLNKLRPHKRHLATDLEPRIFFAPVNKRSKTKTIIGDEDSA
ncbi:hypothetical protein INT48_008407 [Thamnidium elegans]|uniref:Uncharacterized protein n=1 Tax=Thamnidium elegans TaxID=101142 RepID=A0A8H7SJF3_9FUNG|nr:hypothetical protein INT48_008407 [Thamnidium elegans]